MGVQTILVLYVFLFLYVDGNVLDLDECLNYPCKNGGSCLHTNGSYSCTCAIGWDGKTCSTDVNECLNTPCEHGGNCTNANGTYTCDCPVGWQGKNCATDILPADFILITDNAAGTVYRLDINNYSYVNVPLQYTNHYYDIDYDQTDANIFWTDGLYIFSGSIYGNSLNTVRSFTDGSEVFGIALDPMSRLLFYTDRAKGVIGVLSLEHNSHKLVIRNVGSPCDIVTDQINGIIYWLQSEYYMYSMEKSSYDGTNRMPVMNVRLESFVFHNPPIINDMDINVRVLYWCDGNNGTIERVNANGSNRQLIYWTEAEQANSCSVAVYQSYLFFTFGSDVKRIGTDGTGLISVASTEHMSTNAIHVHTNRGQGINRCSNGGCSHFCFPLPGGSKRCDCPDLMTLQPDGHTCTNSRLLLLTESSRDGSYQTIYVKDLSNDYLFSISIQSPGKPYATTYDPITGIIYWTDTSFHRIASTSISGNTQRIIRQLQETASLVGISIDAISRLLFYTDKTNGIIAALMLDGYTQKIVINSILQRPYDIVTDPINGKIYWTSFGTEGMIETSNYDGTSRIELIKTGLIQASGLAIDIRGGVLYWCIGGTVYRATTKGMNRQLIFQDNAVSINRIAFDQSYLYYTTFTQGGAMKMDSYGSNPINIAPNDFTQFVDIHVQTNEPEYIGTNGCSSGRGNCSHFCFPRPGGDKVCACPDGMILQPDGQTCEQCVTTLQTECTLTTRPAQTSHDTSGSTVNVTVIVAVVGSLAGLLVIGVLLIVWCVRRNGRLCPVMVRMLPRESPPTNSTAAADQNDEYDTISKGINTELRTEPQAFFNVSTHTVSYRSQREEQEGYITATAISIDSDFCRM